MANQLHLDILLQGVEVWNRWREQNPGISPDLSRADLKGMVLPGVNLAGVNLQGANLRETIFEDANFLGADLRGVNLQQAELRKADLSEANLNRANLRQADLRDANLVEASMAGVELGQAKLQGVMLSKKGPRRAKPGLGGRSQTPPPRRSSTAPVPAKRRKKAALGSVVRPAAKRRRLLFLVLGPSHCGYRHRRIGLSSDTPTGSAGAGAEDLRTSSGSVHLRGRSHTHRGPDRRLGVAVDNDRGRHHEYSLGRREYPA